MNAIQKVKNLLLAGLFGIGKAMTVGTEGCNVCIGTRVLILGWLVPILFPLFILYGWKDYYE
jgi:hypothetical protein